MEHCKEHHDQEICVVKLKKDLEAIKNDGHSKLDRLANQVHNIWEELSDKLDSSTFYRIVTIFVIILLAVLGVQWRILFGIDNKVDDIAINQAVIASKLKVELVK